MSNFTDGGTVCSFIVKENNLAAKASLCLVLANGIYETAKSGSIPRTSRVTGTITWNSGGFL